jgi:hypothetical protein
VDVSAGRFDTPTWGIRAVGGSSSMRLGSADGTGAAMAAAGDVNGDGLADVALGAAGAPLANGKAYGSGTVFMVFGARTPGQMILRPGERFNGYEIPHPGAATTGFGAAVARLGRGLAIGAPGDVFGRLQGRGRVWTVPRRGAPPTVAQTGPARGGPIGLQVATPGDVAGDAGPDVLAVGRGRHSGPVPAFLFSAAGRRLACYAGLRNSLDARSAAAGAGDVGANRRPDLIFGSPGAGKAYVLLSR